MQAFSPKAYGRILWREAAEQYTFCIGIFVILIVIFNKDLPVEQVANNDPEITT
mgnify:CR=1 FL=1